MISINLQSKKTKLGGDITLPASKSISNRLLVINAISGGKIKIDNLSSASDTQIMKSLLSDSSSTKDVKDAGTVMRFLTAFYAIGDQEIVIKGTERMHNRPISVLVEALNSLGANIEYMEKNGYPPLSIKPFQPLNTCQELEIDSSISSQYISGLMMIGPYLPTGLWLKLKGKIASEPYIKMTLALMKICGASVEFIGNKVHIKSGKYTSAQHFVEADWSAASYWYSLLALANNGKIELKGLHKNSTQGDSAVISLFENLGVKTTYTENGIELEKVDINLPKELPLDFSNNSDLAQTLAVFCAVKGIKLTMTGVESLKIKETNRIAALRTELKKLDIEITESENHYTVYGQLLHNLPKNLIINTYNDHRMAMAFAPLAILGEITFEDETVVNKSYPNFWNEIENLVQ